jgi:hypothetical protein
MVYGVRTLDAAARAKWATTLERQGHEDVTRARVRLQPGVAAKPDAHGQAS